MSETDTPSKTPESQHQRWLKYGLNVGVMTIVAIAIVSLLTYLAEAHDHRIDTTVSGAQSLSPQTINIIKDNKHKIRIVALYPKLKTEEGQQDFYQPVVDLLSNYSRAGSNITTEVIDPNTDQDRLKKLISDITNEYGGDLKNYKSLVADIPPTNDVLSKYSHDENEKVSGFSFENVQDQDLYYHLQSIRGGIRYIGAKIEELKAAIETDMEQPVPSYKDAKDQIAEAYTAILGNLTAIPAKMESLQNVAGLPKQFKEYIPDALKRAAEAKKTVDALLERIKQLPPLKESDEFRRQLTSKSIVVMGDTGYKIIQSNQIWTPEPRNLLTDDVRDEEHRNRFTGEQRISTAVASLESAKKPVVVFVRPAGLPPLSASRGRISFGLIADRLRENNFEVRDKQIGQSPEQQPPEEPEATEEEMKSGVWIVLRLPGDNPMAEQMPGMPGMPSPIESMLAEHLKSGGSALVLEMPQADAMTSALDQMGVRVRTQYMLMHEVAPRPERSTSDQVAIFAKMLQFAFMTNEYGDHPLTAPLAHLDFQTWWIAPVEKTESIPAGVTVTSLLPIPTSLNAWGAKDGFRRFQENRGEPLKFDAGVDISQAAGKPFYMAAAVDKAGAGRLVVVGSFYFMTNDLSGFADDKDPQLPRLPGNAEFAMDTVFWLCRQDSMLAISPHMLETPRVKNNMSTAKQNFYRVGVLLAGLPLAVVAAGFLVFLRRRD